MTLTSCFSCLRLSRRRPTRTGARRNRSRACRRTMSFDALEGRVVLSTVSVSFGAATESVNESAGTFAIPVTLSSPPAGTPTVSEFAAINCDGGMAVDASGNLYVADPLDDEVREVTPSGGVSIFATGLLTPEGLAFGPNGNLYVANKDDGVDQVTPAGHVIPMADGSAFDDPIGIAVDLSGNVYVSNSGNGTVDKITPAGVISLYATGFNSPAGLALDDLGNLYVVNNSQSTNGGGTVVKVTPEGATSILASGFSLPDGLAFDVAGDLFVASGENTGVVSEMTPTGTVSTFVSGTDISEAGSLTFDGAGNLYVANENDNVVEKVTQTVAVPFTPGGSAVSGVDYDGVTASPLLFGIGMTRLDITGTLLPDANKAPTLTFALGSPTGGAVLGSPDLNTMTINEPVVVQFASAGETVSESDGNFSIPLTISETPTEPASVAFSLGGSAVSGVTFSGVTASPLTFGVGQTTVDITGTLLSDPGPDQTLTITLDSPATGAVVVSPTANTLTITEPARVQFETASETINESTGTFSIPVTMSGTPTVSTFVSGFGQPMSVAVDAHGDLYVADAANGTVSKVTPAGVSSTFVSGLDGPIGLAFDATGNLYVANAGNNTVSVVSPAGVVTNTIHGFDDPGGVAVDPAGNLYVANTDSDTVSKVTPAGVVSTFASGFVEPLGLAFHAGNLYVANSASDTVSEVSPAGAVSTLVSGLNGPLGLAFDAAGNLYVTVGGNNSVSEVTPAGVASTLATGFDEPSGVVLAAGNLYVANSDNGTLSEVTQIVEVPFTLGGSATSGVDFSGVTASPLLFGIGQTTEDITGRILPNPGSSRTLTIALDAPIGNAALGSPSTNTLTINESATGTPTPTPTSTGTGVPPVFLGEQRVFSGKGKHKKLRGFEFVFNAALNPATAQSTSNYHVTQKKGRKVKVLWVKSALDNSSKTSVTITVGAFQSGKPAQAVITGLTGADGAAISPITTRL